MSIKFLSQICHYMGRAYEANNTYCHPLQQELEPGKELSDSGKDNFCNK